MMLTRRAKLWEGGMQTSILIFAAFFFFFFFYDAYCSANAFIP